MWVIGLENPLGILQISILHIPSGACNPRAALGIVEIVAILVALQQGHYQVYSLLFIRFVAIAGHPATLFKRFHDIDQEAMGTLDIVLSQLQLAIHIVEFGSLLEIFGIEGFVGFMLKSGKPATVEVDQSLTGIQVIAIDKRLKTRCHLGETHTVDALMRALKN